MGERGEARSRMCPHVLERGGREINEKKRYREHTIDGKRMRDVNDERTESTARGNEEKTERRMKERRRKEGTKDWTLAVRGRRQSNGYGFARTKKKMLRLFLSDALSSVAVVVVLVRVAEIDRANRASRPALIDRERTLNAVRGTAGRRRGTNPSRGCKVKTTKLGEEREGGGRKLLGRTMAATSPLLWDAYVTHVPAG